RAKVPCLHLVDAFDDGQKLLEAAEQHRLKGVVSKRRAAPYQSGPSGDWLKVKTQVWREANRERWRLFEKSQSLRLWVTRPAWLRLETGTECLEHGYATEAARAALRDAFARAGLKQYWPIRRRSSHYPREA